MGDLDLDLDIFKLKILLNTNKNSIIELTSKLFLFDDNRSINGEEYPLLCTNVAYNQEYLSNQTHFDRVQIFFNKSAFNTFLLTSKTPHLSPDDELQLNKNITENIMMMLNAIFPISFPIKDNIISTYNESSVFDLQGMFQTVFKTSEYVYLNIDKPCTVIQVMWLDTVIKNPIYINLYEHIKKYKKEIIDYFKIKSQTTKTNSNKHLLEIFNQIQDLKDLKENRQYYNNRLNNESSSIKEIKRIISLYEKQIKSLHDSLSKHQTDENKQTYKDLIQKLLDDLYKISDVNDDIKTNFGSITANLTNDDLENKDKKEIQEIITKYNDGNLTDKTILKSLREYATHGQTYWKLYFIFARLKKNTQKYNTFIPSMGASSRQGAGLAIGTGLVGGLRVVSKVAGM